MFRYTRALALTTVIALALGIAVSATASAQDSPSPDIPQSIPPGDPGDFDLTEEDERFGRLVEEFGESTDIADFGDGSTLTGPCGGQAFSYDADGQLIDAMIDVGDDGPPIDMVGGGQAATASNPFKVDSQGTVNYFGFYPRVGDGPRDHMWEITTGDISLDFGGDANPNGNNRNAGSVNLGDELPFGLSFKTKIEGSIMSDLDPCFGQGHIAFEGPFPPATIPGAVGGAAILAGIFGLLFNARPAVTWKA
jgi:hypothetical protein